MENSGFRRTALPCSLCHTQANRRRMLHARRETRPARSVGTSRSEAAARPTQPGGRVGGAHSTDGSLAHNDPTTQSPRAGGNSASPLPPRHSQGCRGPAMAALAPGTGVMGAGACAEVRPAGSAPRGTHTNPKPPRAGLRGSESRQGDKAGARAGRAAGALPRCAAAVPGEPLPGAGRRARGSGRWSGRRRAQLYGGRRPAGTARGLRRSPGATSGKAKPKGRRQRRGRGGQGLPAALLGSLLPSRRGGAGRGRWASGRAQRAPMALASGQRAR